MTGSGMGRFVPSAVRRIVEPTHDGAMLSRVAELESQVDELSRELAQVRSELGDALDYLDRQLGPSSVDRG